MPTSTLTPTEAQAAELEGLKPANAAVLRLITAHEDAKAAKVAAEKLRDAAAKELGKLLESGDLQGFTYGGKVVVRLSTVRTPRFENERFKLSHPRLWAAFTKITVSKRLNVTP